jgi:hypothetical protein
MARRPKKNQGGFPEDGDELPVDPPENEDTPPEEEQQEEEDEEQEDKPDPLKDMQRQMDQMKTDHAKEMADLRRNIGPAAPKEPKEEKPKTSYKDLIFTDPDKAVEQIQNEAVEKATALLRGQYERDQGTQKFWAGFYEKHKDLKDDKDLVELTLNSNLPSLANIPVDDAMKKLADLTRERIIRYSGGTKRNGKKAVVEGNSPPSERRPPAIGAEVTSLGDVIRARRRKRASAA